MKTDYKFWFITRDDDGYIVKCGIRFYEGEITTKDENDIDGNPVPVTRYRRSKLLTKTDLSYLNDSFVKDGKGQDAKLYTPAEFGEIKTDDELRTFLNNELAKDSTRTSIDEQK